MPTQKRQKPKKKGRIQYKRNDEHAKLAKSLSGFAVPKADIALELGVSLDTLYRHYREDMQKGDVAAKARIGQSLFELGVVQKDRAARQILCKV